MKKGVRFAAIFVLASGVLLAGCGTKNDVSSSVSNAASSSSIIPSTSSATSSPASSSSTSSDATSSSESSTSEVTPTITIADTLAANAKELVVGASIDLADYVTIAPAVSWSIAATNANVTVAGHVFTAAQPGAYVITITAGNSSASVGGTVISVALDAIKTVLSDDWGGSNYTATLKKGEEQIAVAEHNDGYAMLDYNGKKQGYLLHVGSEGTDSSVYAFTVENGALVVAPGKYDQALGFNSFTSSFPATVTDYADEMVNGVATGKVVIAKRTKMIPAIGNYTLGMDLSKLEPTKLVVSKGEDKEGNATLTYALYKEDVDLGYAIVCSSFESTTNAMITAYCNGDVVPTPYSQAEVNDNFAAMNSGKTYTLSASCNWTNAKGEALDSATADSLAGDTGLVNETYTEYVNASSLYVVTSSTGAVKAHVAHADSAGTASLYQVTSADGKTFSATNEETALGGTDVWAIASLASLTTSPFTAALLATLDVMGRTVDSTTGLVTLTGYYCPGTEDLLSACLKAVPLVGEDMASLWEGYEPFFGDQTYTYDPTAKTLTVACTVFYSSEDDQYWHYALTYSGIGTDAVPTAYQSSIASWPAK